MPKRRAAELIGLGVLGGVAAASLALLTWSVEDPSLNHATSTPVHNLLGAPGAIASDIAMQFFGLACVVALTPPAFWGWRLITRRRLERARLRLALWLVGSTAAAGFASFLPAPDRWPLPTGLGGVLGDAVLGFPGIFSRARPAAMLVSGLALPGRDPGADRRGRLRPDGALGRDGNRGRRARRRPDAGPERIRRA